jgi:hypothetical protein
MAHFAKLDNDETVVEIIVIDNEALLGLEFPHSEPVGQKYISELGLEGTWLQTSYNGNFRKAYAGLGYLYNKKLDAFIAPKPYNSWSLNTNTAQWQPPIPYPNDKKVYTWNEDSKAWEQLPMPVLPTLETQSLPKIKNLPPLPFGPEYEVE